MKILIIALLSAILLTSVVSAVCVDYYYNPNCAHCQQIAPFIEQVKAFFTDVKWTDHNVVEEQMSVGTPTAVVNKQITLTGSADIPRWLPCELQEMSTQSCPTYSASEKNRPTESWFMR